MAKHTPGPWVAVDDILDPDDEGNARSFVRPVHSEGWQIAQTCGPNGSDNARLIAASPDLLKALKALSGAVFAPNADGAPSLTLAAELSVAALAKAEGR